mgnify:FL=1
MARGRPRKKPDDDPLDGVVETPRDDLDTLTDEWLKIPIGTFLDPSFELPGIAPRKINGEYNPAHFSDRMSVVNRRYSRDLMTGEKSNWNPASGFKMILDEADACGVSNRSVLDRRSEADKASDFYREIAKGDRTLCEGTDEELRALKSMMDKADAGAIGVIEEKLHTEEDDPRSPKAWRERINLVLSLRERARKPVARVGLGYPSSTYNLLESRYPGIVRAGLEAAHVLRFMVYVGRSSMDTAKRFSREQNEVPTAAETVFDIAPHHCQMAVSLWEANNGVWYGYDSKEERGIFKRGVIPFEYCIMKLPIGHGKTEFCIHDDALAIAKDPRYQGLYLHAKESEAKKNLAQIKRFFDRKESSGRRFLSLFPLELTKNQNDSTRLRVKVADTPKSPTITATGTDSASLGTDAPRQTWDDIVPQSDADQPTERERRKNKLAGTFMSRKRGQKVMVKVVGTPWHEQDSLMHLSNLAKDNVSSRGQRGILAVVLTLRCGGPKSVPAFKPLWEKVYDSAALRRKYNELGPRLYAAAMMMDPTTDEQRIVKRIRLYDPLAPEHKAFIESSVKYISLDPAATKQSGSDKAGIIYAGFGTVRVERDIDGIPTVDTEKRVRLLAAHEIHATQSDLADYTMNFARNQPVDYVMAEMVGGFAGIEEMFMGYGIDVIRCHPGIKNKETRLRGVAPIIEDSNASQGFRAVCEFPGVWKDGKLVLDEAFKNLVEQVIEFKSCARDDMVDALSQLLGHLSPDLGVGRGIVSRQAEKIEAVSRDPRLQAIIKRIMGTQKEATIEEEEDTWLKQNWR